MNEKEAKNKWCPMATRLFRQTTESGAFAMAYGNDPEGRTRVNCIASDCMMWTKTMIQYEGDDGNQYIDTDDGRCGLVHVR